MALVAVVLVVALVAEMTVMGVARSRRSLSCSVFTQNRNMLNPVQEGQVRLRVHPLFFQGIIDAVRAFSSKDRHILLVSKNLHALSDRVFFAELGQGLG